MALHECNIKDIPEKHPETLGEGRWIACIGGQMKTPYEKPGAFIPTTAVARYYPTGDSFDKDSPEAIAEKPCRPGLEMLAPQIVEVVPGELVDIESPFAAIPLSQSAKGTALNFTDDPGYGGMDSRIEKTEEADYTVPVLTNF